VANLCPPNSLALTVAEERDHPDAGHALDEGEVARLYRLGLTMVEIAELCQVSAWAIAARLDRAGVARRAPGERAGLPLERAVRRYRRKPGLLGELAAGLGISPEVIAARAARPLPRSRGAHRADVPAGDVARLYQAGLTVTQVASRYQAAPSTVLRRLDEAGVPRRPSSRPAPAVFPVGEAVRRVRQEGASFAEIARSYQVSADVVRRQLTARGVRAPRGVPRLRRVPAAEVAVLYQRDRLSTAQIAARYGVSRWLIGARLDNAGLARRPRGRLVEVDAAAALYREGASLAAVAARYQVGARTMRRHLIAAGVTLRPPGRQRTDIPVDEAAGLYTAGQTMAQIAVVYGTCATVIYNRLAEAGVPIRRRTDVKPVDPGLLDSLARQVGLDGVR
jgi:transposase-like protein